MKLFKDYLERKGIKISEAKATDYFAFKEIEDIEKLKADETAKIYDEFRKFQNDQLQIAIDEKASKEDIIDLKKSINEQTETQIKRLSNILKKQGEFLSELSEKTNLPDIPVTRDMAATMVAKLRTEHKEELEAYIKKGTQFQLELKVPGTMTSGNISGGDVPQAQRLEGFDTVPSRRIRMIDVVSNRGTTSNVVEWTYQDNKDGTAGQTAEGAVKNQIDYDIVVGRQAAKKTTAFIKVTTEMLNDIVWLEQEIRAELTREILKVVESQLYEGDNTGENHNGIRTVAAAFAAGSFVGTVDNANILDVLVVAMTQIQIAQEGDMIPNYVFVHPNTVAALKLTKVSTTDRRYVDRLVMAGSNLQFDGVTIIPTTLVTDGEYLIGDFTFAELYTHESMEIMMGLENDDFTRNLRTIIAEWRGMTVVRNQRRSGFVAGVFATDAAALETP